MPQWKRGWTATSNKNKNINFSFCATSHVGFSPAVTSLEYKHKQRPTAEENTQFINIKWTTHSPCVGMHVFAGCLNFTELSCCQKRHRRKPFPPPTVFCGSSVEFSDDIPLWQLSAAGNTYATKTMPRVQQRDYCKWNSSPEVEKCSPRVSSVFIYVCPCVQRTF